MKIAVGDLRRVIREAVSAAEAAKDVDAAIKELFAAAGGNSKIVAGAMRSWYKKVGRNESKLPLHVPPGLFSVGSPISSAEEEGLTPGRLQGFFRDATYAYSLYAARLPETAEWIRGPVMAEIEIVKAKTAADPRGEDPSAPLGRFAWPGARVRGASVPWEPDTKEESALLDRIDAYFSLNHNIPPEDAEKLLSMYQQGLYSDVLKGPDAEFVYRGMGVGSNWLRKLLRLGPEDPIPPNGTAEVDASYRASRGAAISWSMDKEVALDFARGSFKNRRDTGAEYTLLVTAKVSDNPKVFLTGPGGLYKLKVPSGYKKESEVLALDSVKLHSIEWRSVAAAEAEYNAKKAAAAAAKGKAAPKKK